MDVTPSPLHNSQRREVAKSTCPLVSGCPAPGGGHHGPSGGSRARLPWLPAPWSIAASSESCLEFRIAGELQGLDYAILYRYCVV